MKIVTYNVNGLRQRISQFGSLLKLLDSLEADIICFQEIKLSRQELATDLAIAVGYESFFSCTRTSHKGRVGYSGVATFCRVKSAFASREAALPVAAEEGFTGLIGSCDAVKGDMNEPAQGLDGFDKDELLKVDSEGRCVITDHGHFVLFNIYGPRADCDDLERTEFKVTFYKILQKRWEFLIGLGRRIFVVGDLNISPAAIDSCRAGPDFDMNECRRWFRSMLVDCGGPFFDVFRQKHPERKEAYTCWPQNTGAEEFNYGTRIDHILSTGSCLHQEQKSQRHGFITCHVIECDILTKFKRWKPGDTPRWKGGRSTKREGSDHAPVFMSLSDIPDIVEHSTPPLSTRYIPKLHGLQQTIVSLLMKRQVVEQSKDECMSRSTSHDNVTIGSINVNETFDRCSTSNFPSDGCSSSSKLEETRNTCSTPGSVTKKRARSTQLSQLSLRSFFKKHPSHNDQVDNTSSCTSFNQTRLLNTKCRPDEAATDDEKTSEEVSQLKMCSSRLDEGELHSCDALGKEKNGIAFLEWQRIQQAMQNSIPLCKGHNEPCVPRVVKKMGANYGRRFYVCARAEGPRHNPEANCNYFKWASSKSRRK